MSTRAKLLLNRQLNELLKHPNQAFSVGLVDDSNIFLWEVMLFGPPDTFYEGGLFKAHLVFPHDYPLSPPRMRFVTQMWHPNIYRDGKVCISILHDPGDDPFGYEAADERWLPVRSVESILLSVISMLSSPNYESPANTEAARMWRNDRGEFKRIVALCVRKSQEAEQQPIGAVAEDDI